jgi:YidC/Oxa1 family membrane protein insertase
MNKTDRLIVALLFCALIGWSVYGRKFMPKPQPVPAAEQAGTVAAGSNNTAVVDSGAPVEIQAASTNVAAQAAVAVDESQPEVEPIHQTPQKTLVLANDVLSLEFSSWGGGITSAELIEIYKDKLKYPEVNEDDSGPVTFDFSKHPALAYNGIPGLSSLNDFELTALPSQNGIEMKAENGSGLLLTRTAMLTNGYVLVVTDRITNSSDAAVMIPASQMNLGSMSKIETKAKTRGISYLGTESRDSAEGKVTRWDKKLPKLFGQSSGCSRVDLTGVPLRQELKNGNPPEWVAVKNKFFVQVLIPEDGGSNSTFFAERKDTDARVVIEKVSAVIGFDEKELTPGESYVRTSRYYVGPKKYSEMRALGGNQDRIILRSWPWFGWWRMACAGMLWLMNSLNAITHNYGVAIILLTIIVKVVFWPVTHKGTESMKRMKEIQPELTKLREKYKDNPKKIQEKQMQLYRENGVNPVAGCLPMLIQMPVFIALFTVLRSAVELRYQPFLWIKDLCEPEAIITFGFQIPLLGNALNILPIIMAATMFLQQKLTPAAGDPQQQKMMQFMPLMMLFMFYNMASALVLYWSVSQGLSILQLYLQQRKEKQTA